MTLKIIISFLLGGIIIPLNAQIKGTVSDSENKPIEFANVAIYSLPDSTLIAGTTTDDSGAFLLTADNSSNKLLRVSFIGYETQEIPVGNQSIINVSLQLDLSELMKICSVKLL